MDWTSARLKAFIIAALRSATRRYPPKYQAKDLAKTERKLNPKSGKLAQFYRCASCGEEFTSTQVEVDHIVPVIDPAKGFETWDKYIERMFCGPENFQVLCVACHKEKTQQEKEQAKNESNSTSKRTRRNSKV